MSAAKALLSTRKDRLRLVAIGVTAALGSFAETVALLVISAAALKFATDVETTASSLPFGLDGEEFSTGELVGLGAALVVVRLAMLSQNARLATSLTARVLLDLRQRIVSAFQSASYETTIEETPGLLQTLTQTHATNAARQVDHLAAGVTALTSLLVFLASAVLVHPFAALLLLGFGVLMAALLRPFTQAVRRAGMRQAHHTTEFGRRLSEASATRTEQHAFGVSGAVGEGLTEELEVVVEAERFTNFMYRFSPQIYTSIGMLGVLLGIQAADQLNYRNAAAIGAITLLVVRSMVHGQILQQTAQSLAGSQEFVHLMFNVVEDYEASRVRHGDQEVGPLECLELRSATLGYPSCAVLQDVDLVVEAGESIGLVGPSGAGKSTLAYSLLRMLPPLAGSFDVNGVEAASVSQDRWHQLVGHVPQESVLIEGTIADNVRFYRAGVEDAAIRRALSDAQLSREVMSWPSGLLHDVGPSGNRLSGGQRQRLCIARALAADPELIVLDEPTSALDSEAESAVSDVLHSLKGSRTMVIVAHRLSTLEHCDRVLLVADGGVRDIGTGPEIVANPQMTRGWELAEEFDDG